MHLDLVKHMIKTSNVEIVFIYAAKQLSVTNILMLHVHHHVSIHSSTPQLWEYSISLFFNLAKITAKKEVKACYSCKNADSCKPEKLTGSEIRTSGVFGAKNLYCYTVCKRKLFYLFHHSNLFLKYNYVLFSRIEIRSKDRCCCRSWWFWIWWNIR